MKLMLVDDEERYLVTTRKLLTRKGYDVVTASSGREALEKLREQEVHVVILDVKMPGMDGNEVLRNIRSLFPLVEVIMLTGHATLDSAVEGLKAGARDYLMKPAEIDEIIAKAQEAFESRKQVESRIRNARIRKVGCSPGEQPMDGTD
jgi:DNA-binding response OmpR family regulator